MSTGESGGAPSAPAIRYTGTLEALSPEDRRRLIDRAPQPDSDIRARTTEIISDVRQRGDQALRDLSARFDGVQLESLEVSRDARRRALASLATGVRSAMERAIGNLQRVHEASLPKLLEVEPEPGVVIGRRPDALGRIGVYAPGGRAAYASSVLMGAVPARVAGVGEVILCSPPARTGAPAAVVLAAAELAGVDRIFAIGGAGAIAAMALGTDSVPRVNRIIGPGNAYVAEAKLQLVGSVAIDSPAGPSELLVIADASSSPELVADEMLAQAEHDPLACVMAVCVGWEVAARVIECIDQRSSKLATVDTAALALAGQGAVLSAESMDEAITFANEYAPEHLLLSVEETDSILPRMRNAGTIMVGASSSVAFGDYLTGSNHVLPTGGLARSYSGLSVLDFIRWTSYQRVTAAAASRLADDTAAFALAEMLPGHALAAARWRAGECV